MTRNLPPVSHAQQLVGKLMQAFVILRNVLPHGVKGLPTLRGLTAAHYIDSQVVVLQRAAELLQSSQRVFRYEDGIVLESEQLTGQGKHLVALLDGGEVSHSSVALLSNLFVIQTGDRTIPIPQWFAGQLLHSAQVRGALPVIKHYAQRPVFDQDFNLRGPGWHPESGILVHGPEIEPDLTDHSQQGTGGVDHLPPHLRELLSGFCFATPTDLANLLGMMLSGLLMNHFLEAQKALCIVDGNQPGLGKTLLVRAVGTVNDGVDPTLIAYTPNDEELAKRIGADLRARRQSVVIVDNAKEQKETEISSAFLEANSVAPVISIRILGHSRNHLQKNNLLWFLTMNNTKASRDLISRAVVVQLHHEGDPKSRDFEGFDPVGYAFENRLNILGELAGLVIRWNQAGRPMGSQQHRLHTWARLIGGILEQAGFPEFLSNASQIEGSFSSELEKLASLAEVAIRRTLQACATNAFSLPEATMAMTATQWEPLFNLAGIMSEELQGQSTHSKAVRIGRFFAPYLHKEVEFDLQGATGKAILKVENGRGKSRSYYFDLTWDPAPGALEAEPSANPAAALPALMLEGGHQIA